MASQAMSRPRRAGPGRGEGERGRPRAREEETATVNPEDVVRRPVTSLVQRCQHATHWHDVILDMSALITATQGEDRQPAELLSTPLFPVEHERPGDITGDITDRVSKMSEDGGRMAERLGSRAIN